jgi:hypothetical protein
MKRLKKLANALKDNNFEMTDEIKNEFEEYLSIIATGSRVLHPRFGLGTVFGTQGETWVGVYFDKEVAYWEEENKKKEEEKKANPNKPSYYYARRGKPRKYVHITSCTSIDLLIKNELKKQIKDDTFTLAHKPTEKEPWS